MVARLLVAGSARTGREARSGDGAGATAPPLLLRGDRRGAARRLRPCARGRPACRHHHVGAVALRALEPPALPAPPRRSGGRPGGGVGVSGGGRSRADDTDTWRSPRLWPQHHWPGGVRPVGSARRGHWPLLVAGPLAGVAGRLLVSGQVDPPTNVPGIGRRTTMDLTHLRDASSPRVWKIGDGTLLLPRGSGWFV